MFVASPSVTTTWQGINETTLMRLVAERPVVIHVYRMTSSAPTPAPAVIDSVASHADHAPLCQRVAAVGGASPEAEEQDHEAVMRV